MVLFVHATRAFGRRRRRRGMKIATTTDGQGEGIPALCEQRGFLQRVTWNLRAKGGLMDYERRKVKVKLTPLAATPSP